MVAPRTSNEAIASCARQELHGPDFAVGTCKKQTRLAYLVPSDGSESATEARARTKLRLDTPGSKAPRGAILWWTGGSQGYGHVAIADGKGGVWSTDIIRPGRWGHVKFETIGTKWPSLRWAGVSLDIEGVQVCFPPVEKPATPKEPLAITRFRNSFNNDRFIDLNDLDLTIKAGLPRKHSAAAKVCKWACINAARAYLKVVG